MAEKTTQLTTDNMATTATSTSNQNSAAGSPRKSTLDMIRQFARAYQFQAAAAIPVGIILN